MRICIIIDTWKPQINGVVTTFTVLRDALEKMGHEVMVIHPFLFEVSMRCPSDHELILAIPTPREFKQLMAGKHFDIVHIATEGTLGVFARKWCLRHRIPFTSSYLTQVPEYIKKRFRVPARLIYPLMRRFHAKAAATLVPSASVQKILQKRRFINTVVWPGGVDTGKFRPIRRPVIDSAKPVWLFVGRIAPEKNIQAFLKLDLPGTKYVVGEGTERRKLEKRYPEARFLGKKTGKELRDIFASADVFVFPSKTDTFGLVMLEAMACGTPVAAYPVQGPKDLVSEGISGALDVDLRSACMRALKINRKQCREYAKQFSWDVSAKQFLDSVITHIS